MKLLAILGSRDHNGRTAQATGAFAAGAASVGADIQNLFLTEQQIERCKQCDAQGWGNCRSQGVCVIDDDFSSIVNEIFESDIIVFSTPVYWGDLSESMRAFLDRLRRITTCTEIGSIVQGKPAIGICVAGGGGGGSISCALSLEKILRTCGFDVFDIIPVRRQNLEMKKPVLEISGRWIAQNM